MADQQPAVPPLSADPPQPAAPAPAAAPAQPAAPAAPPAGDSPRQTPDSVTLTKRELEALTERAAARAIEQHRKEPPVANQPQTPETPNPSPDAVAQLRADMEAMRAEQNKAIEAANARAEAAEQKAAEAEKARKRARERATEATLKSIAAQAGVEDVDYALVLFARATSDAVNARDAKGEPAPKAPPQPEAFFAGLRATKPALFKAGAPTPPPANTAPDDGGAPPPSPAAPGTRQPSADDDVTEMKHDEWAQRTRDRYGFNPSLGN